VSRRSSKRSPNTAGLRSSIPTRACPREGGGRYTDNIFVERLRRSLKYEEIYLNAYAGVAEAKPGIGSWLAFITRSAGTRAWAIARRVRPTKHNANHRIDIDEAEGRSNVVSVAPSAIAAGTEIGRLHLRKRLRLSHDRRKLMDASAFGEPFLIASGAATKSSRR
jgi:hypothetical protein